MPSIVVVAGFLIYALNEISKASDFEEFTQMRDVVDAAKVAVSLASAAAVAATKLAGGSGWWFFGLYVAAFVILVAFLVYERYLRSRRSKAGADPVPDSDPDKADDVSVSAGAAAVLAAPVVTVSVTTGASE